MKTFSENTVTNINIISVILVGFVCMFGGCYACLNIGSFYVYSYKQKNEFITGEGEFPYRFSKFSFPEVTLFLRWHNLDLYNRKADSDPTYQLLAQIEPIDPEFISLQIQKIELKSDLGKTYSFSPKTSWPVEFTVPQGKKRGVYSFDPAFMFNHQGDEVINSKLWMKIITKSKETEKILETEWVPIKYKINPEF